MAFKFFEIYLWHFGPSRRSKIIGNYSGVRIQKPESGIEAMQYSAIYLLLQVEHWQSITIIKAGFLFILASEFWILAPE